MVDFTFIFIYRMIGTGTKYSHIGCNNGCWHKSGDRLVAHFIVQAQQHWLANKQINKGKHGHKSGDRLVAHNF
ncbi:hypothetical protein CCACVL1_10804 [Corchorus capsularis]|uniref:Uncharacterized protein n=1 Tax=Corchorus capsularis TaxID=210143 RepID=A0A1R3IPI5_COCAP|nr:hypothetical protein CCACVL1_10804 [Corchorus capsularis]